MPRSGTMTVPMMKAFVLTRVRYSRLIIRRILRMGGLLDKYFVERRLEQFEPRDASARLHGGFENFLWIGTRLQFHLDSASKAIHSGNDGEIQKAVGAGELDANRVFAVGFLDGAQVAVENVAPLVEEANGIEKH